MWLVSSPRVLGAQRSGMRLGLSWALREASGKAHLLIVRELCTFRAMLWLSFYMERFVFFLTFPKSESNESFVFKLWYLEKASL